MNQAIVVSCSASVLSVASSFAPAVVDRGLETDEILGLIFLGTPTTLLSPSTTSSSSTSSRIVGALEGGDRLLPSTDATAVGDDEGECECECDGGEFEEVARSWSDVRTDEVYMARGWESSSGRGEYEREREREREGEREWYEPYARSRSRPTS